MEYIIFNGNTDTMPVANINAYIYWRKPSYNDVLPYPCRCFCGENLIGAGIKGSCKM
jgi:hypothetical protein